MPTTDNISRRDWTEIEPEYPEFQAKAWEDDDGNRLIAESQPGPYGDGWRVFYETHKEDTLYGGETMLDVPTENASVKAAAGIIED